MGLRNVKIGSAKLKVYSVRTILNLVDGGCYTTLQQQLFEILFAVI